jgi:ankyrin repeat protein
MSFAATRTKEKQQAACYSQTPSLELVEYLISNGVDVNEKPAETDGVTALQAAAIRGHMEIALKLLDAGANVNAPAAGSDGRTAIEGAAEHGRLDMVKLLINAGATEDQTRLNRFHSTIALADKQGHYPVAALLEEHQ